MARVFPTQSLMIIHNERGHERRFHPHQERKFRQTTFCRKHKVSSWLLARLAFFRQNPCKDSIFYQIPENNPIYILVFIFFRFPSQFFSDFVIGLNVHLGSTIYLKMSSTFHNVQAFYFSLLQL